MLSMCFNSSQFSRIVAWKEHLKLTRWRYRVDRTKLDFQHFSQRSWKNLQDESSEEASSIKHFFSRFPSLKDSIFLFSSNVKSPLKLFLSLFVELIEQVNHPSHDDRKNARHKRFLLNHSAFILMNTIHKIILRKTLEGYFVYQKKINKLLLHEFSAYHEAKGKFRKAHLSQINQWFYIKDQEWIQAGSGKASRILIFCSHQPSNKIHELE